MKAEPRWLVWRWESSDRGKRTKVPYRAAHPRAKASSTDPATWADYDTAVATVVAGQADGIGFALVDGEIAAFDLDACRDPDTGVIAPWAWALIEEAQSYTEVTISGTGVRILGLASGDRVHRKQGAPDGGSLETYRRAQRYVVMTGDVLDGYDALLNIDGLIDSTVARLDEEKRRAREAARPQRETDISRYFDQPSVARRDGMPAALDELIRFGVPVGQRSEQFHHAVGWLKDRGQSPGEIETLLAAHPTGIAEKFIDRLRAEIDRAYSKAEARDKREPSRQRLRDQQPHSDELPFILKWHGDPDDSPLKEYLVDKTLPKVGLAFLSGQWGTYKTFVGFDLSASVITGQAFAGQNVMRKGGVLWIAVEGQDEVRIRLAGLVNDRVRPVAASASVDPERLPFVWVEKCPTLAADDALPRLSAIVKAAADGLKERFDLPLALVIIDTLSPAAGFKDANDTAENQKVMTVLISVAREFGTLCMAVDHMGKDVTTGTRNSSVKEDAADAVLALLGEKDLAGKSYAGF